MTSLYDVTIRKHDDYGDCIHCITAPYKVQGMSSKKKEIHNQKYFYDSLRQKESHTLKIKNGCLKHKQI